MITLTLPYPISANRYWRTAVRGTFVSTYVSKEAENFKEQVGWLCKAAGIRTPLTGRVAISVQLYPNRPQDFKTRMRKLGAAWDDGVQCIDIDNANKVLLDALKGIAIEDDKWVRRLSSERMEPDEHGARVVLRIEQLAVPVVQGDLLGAVTCA
ncbi:RusA family crossover junction endodeoxyribonuclease [Variovorax sp. H27-G14]|uniref:RusA family crossover junction endodeoxyribonuclease n=1 Tax=Variovorax sp. H27-G14 TaxID=3111914 RepID=UPI0038FCAD94